MPAKGRRAFKTREMSFEPYDLDGPLQPEFGLLSLSYDQATGNGCYLMRMDPGSETIWHEHGGVEDFYMVEGELIDDDGTVFGPGDFVSYAPGSRHNSRTETGCVILVCEWDKAGGGDSGSGA